MHLEGIISKRAASPYSSGRGGDWLKVKCAHEQEFVVGGFTLPSRTIREMICASVDVVVQAARLRDGSRRITHITEVLGLEGDVIITQDLFLYDLLGEDANGKLIGRHRSTGIGRPRFWDRARYYNEEKRLAAALDAAAEAVKT